MLPAPRHADAYAMGHDHDHDDDHTHDQDDHPPRKTPMSDGGCGHCRADTPTDSSLHVQQAGDTRAHDNDEEHVHSHAKGAHSHDLRIVAVNKLKFAFAITVTFMFVEVIVGLYARSLTLASDGGHMFADAGALLLALIAQQFAIRRATPDRTYGFRRAETLAAFVNGVALTGTALWVLTEAWDRFRHPVPMRAEMVVIVGTLGLFVNLISAWVLSRGTGHNLNTRAALVHVGIDALGSIVAISAGVMAWRFHWYRVDPILSVAMAGLILYGAWSVLKSAVTVLMEGTPTGLDLVKLEETIRSTPGVADLHDLHAWTISEGFDVITVHVVLDGSSHGTDVADTVGDRIHAIHRVAHVTVQPEAPRGQALLPAGTLVHRTN